MLEQFVREESAVLIDLDESLAPLADVAAGAVLSPGKRVRPQFAYWGWRAAGGQPEQLQRVAPALASLELLHAFAVVHDDIMDSSDTRRGLPTAHRRFAAMHADRGLRANADHFGSSMAILTGDLCLVWADRLMSRSSLSAEVLLQARNVYDRMRVETIAGQFLDVLGEASQMWSLRQSMRTIQLKTAAYTVSRPLEFGATLCGPVS